ncbi:hypothetical protein FLA_5980 [Filimonas lacunae]|nr:hypothetical protein FLA_5980 [Filimonas lacunae]
MAFIIDLNILEFLVSAVTLLFGRAAKTDSGANNQTSLK